MDELEYLQSLQRKKPEDKHTLYLIGKFYKEKGLYKEALSVLTDVLLCTDEELRNLAVQEITAISAINSTAEKATVEEDTIEEDDGFDDENDIRYADNVMPFPASVKDDTITFKDIGGLDNLKKAIDMKIIKPFQSPEIFAKFKKKSGGGLLLYGPPGCGKTFIAKATAGECHAYFRSVGVTDILSPYHGESEQNMKNIFATARAKKPCILFFDEIDTLGFNRSKSSSMNSRSIVDQLLVEIEGIDTSTEKLLIIGATNMPWDVDEALRRPGRFDRSVFVHPPDCAAREIIFKLKLNGRPISHIDYKTLAEKSNFFSGADIENVVELAAERVLENILITGDQSLKISQGILIDVLKSARPSTLGWFKTISTYVKYANQAGYYNDVEEYLNLHKSNF